MSLEMLNCSRCNKDKPLQLNSRGQAFKQCLDCRERGRVKDKRKMQKRRSKRALLSEEEKVSTCTKCRNLMTPEKRSNGLFYNMCRTCRVKAQKVKNNNRCEHGRTKYLCVDCNGNGICIHKKQKACCIDCAGSHVCIHKNRKSLCIECAGSQLCTHKKRRSYCKICTNPITVVISNWIHHSKLKDRKYNRYDHENFIDKDFLEELIANCWDKCYYCDRDLQWLEKRDDLGTIERLDNRIGHIKTNCVIACFACNCLGNKRIGLPTQNEDGCYILH